MDVVEARDAGVSVRPGVALVRHSARPFRVGDLHPSRCESSQLCRSCVISQLCCIAAVCRHLAAVGWHGLLVLHMGYSGGPGQLTVAAVHDLRTHTAVSHAGCSCESAPGRPAWRHAVLCRLRGPARSCGCRRSTPAIRQSGNQDPRDGSMSKIVRGSSGPQVSLMSG